MNKPYLKSMDICGFRSFAEPAHIDFSPRINVILGAHGTGKSTVLDAIKWCLCSLVISDYRLIFDGEPDTDIAEVALTFGGEDNDSNTVLKRKVECDKDRRIIKNEFFVNDVQIPGWPRLQRKLTA